MPVHRKQTPQGQPYEPNPEPPMEYTETVHYPSLSRRTRQALGLEPKRKLPKEH